MARELHPWKKRVIRRAQRADGNVLIVAPTGSGKTVIAAHLMRGSKRTLFVAHRRELIAQAEKRCVEWGVKGVGERVILQSKQSLERGSLPEAEVVIFDEAHHVPSKGWARIHAHYKAAGAKIYGLTATPVRLDGKGLADYFDTIVQAPPTSELAAEGHIVEPRVFVPKERIDLREVRVKDRDFDRKGLDKAVRRVVGSIVRHWRERAEGRQTVVYSVSVAHAEAVSSEFKKAKIVSEVIHGGLGVDARDEMLARFESGATQVLVNCEILTEGWDCPSAKCVVLARPTLSFGLLMQMIGRITRPNGEAPVVLDLADNCRYFDRLGLNPIGDLRWSLDSSTPKSVGKARLRRCPECGELFTGSCPCGFKFEKAGRENPEEVDGEVEVWYPKRGLTEEQINECVRRYLAGETATKIASLFGVSEGTALRALRSRGVRIRTQIRLTSEQIDECVSRYLEGESSEAIARSIGVDGNTVRAALRSRGVPVRSLAEAKGSLTEEQINECVWRYLAGETATSIAKSIGVSYCGTVTDALRSRGIRIRTTAGTCKVLSEEQINECVRRYLEGESCRTIARSMGVHGNTVRAVLHSRSVRIRSISEAKRGLSEEQIAECVRMYCGGKGTPSIAKLMSVSRVTVQKALCSRGVRMRSNSEAQKLLWLKVSK